MIRGNRASRATRATGGVSLLVGVASAVALAGAALFTVQQATCADPGTYIRHADHVELVGGCVDGSELPTHGGNDSDNTHDGDKGFYRP
ncbi:hypothetical protein [Haloechinothrix halophila]|uniref:hypothetical protein n=1 Tax=Haloechinothrix halophila TaxID=1069073 RepID=UPI000552DC41|nr:hypothetical protein [Haloechinothrix halophila]